MPGPDDRPLVLTARLAAPEQAWLDAWRAEFFPPERNHLAAHLTLFHALPGAQRASIEAELEAVAATTPPIPARAGGLRFLGRGVAVDITAPALVTLRARLAATWATQLTRQDEQPLRPHVTVCNKVTPERAREVERELATRLTPRAFALPGLALFAYAGGPWEPLRVWRFSGLTAPSTTA
jgi:2'-5' RNA ligase